MEAKPEATQAALLSVRCKECQKALGIVEKPSLGLILDKQGLIKTIELASLESLGLKTFDQVCLSKEEGFDLGCLFKFVQCKYCDVPLGKQYRTVNKQMINKLGKCLIFQSQVDVVCEDSQAPGMHPAGAANKMSANRLTEERANREIGLENADFEQMNRPISAQFLFQETHFQNKMLLQGRIILIPALASQAEFDHYSKLNESFEEAKQVMLQRVAKATQKMNTVYEYRSKLQEYQQLYKSLVQYLKLKMLEAPKKVKMDQNSKNPRYL